MVDQPTDIMIRQKTRIMKPSEYKLLRNEMNPRHQLILDGLLYTGMRVEEFWRFMNNPEWFKPARRVIDLPKGSILKVKAKQKERTVMLSFRGTQAIERLVEGIKKGEVKAITRIAFNRALHRGAEKAGIGKTGITSKMMRKTLISWLMATLEDQKAHLLIAVSSGHDLNTLATHYLGLGFPRNEMDAMKEHIVGWGGT